MVKRTRAEALAGLRVLFRERARMELLAAMALAAMAGIDWQDALDLHAEAMEEESAKVTGRMVENREQSG